MSDPSNPPEHPGDDEETSDKGGDSDPDANEGFAPPDDAVDAAAQPGAGTEPKTSIDDFGGEDRSTGSEGETSSSTGEAQAEENRDRESPS